MGSFFVAERDPAPLPGYGKVLVTYEEFDEAWRNSTQPLVVFIKPKNLSRLTRVTSESPRKILSAEGFVLVTND
jgi:hypothetical protein